jgi:hypothetical protein
MSDPLVQLFPLDRNKIGCPLFKTCNAGPGVAAWSSVADLEWKHYFFAGAAGLAALAGVAFSCGQ